MLDNIRYTITKRTEKPENPKVKNPDEQHTSLFDFGITDHEKGVIIPVRSSIIQDSNKNNIYERIAMKSCFLMNNIFS